jgi:chemotaxis protein methyltransferase CheR
VSELTIGETYFFREPAQFRFVRQTILPEIGRRSGPDHLYRAWSAGCASGEEAYSLAMVFAEEGLAERVFLLATDVSAAALAKARRAAYGPWSLRGEGADAALPHLDRRGEEFVVKESIRRRVVFEPLNLALDVYPRPATGTQGLDLIFCRNVLIYFGRDTVRTVAGRLFAALAPGGWLATASSDPPLGEEAPFETLVNDHGVFYRKAVAARAPGRTPPAVSVRAAPAPIAAAAGEGATGDSGQPPLVNVEDALSAARAELARGDYARAAARAAALDGVAEAAALRVRALANLDPEEAERVCTEAIARYPLSTELCHLRAVLLHGLARDDEAARAARRVLYLDRSLAVSHFLLGTILLRRGDRAGAWRSFRNARDLCAARPDDEVVALSDGQCAGGLAQAAAAQMVPLEPSDTEPRP